MKIKKLLVCAVLILPLAVASPVFAQHGGGSDGDRPVSSEPMDGGTKKTREQRIKERKAKATQPLTMFQQNQVKLGCKAANGLIKTTQTRIASFEAKRTKVYSGLVTRLQELSPKLKAAGIDTVKYDEQAATLKKKADAYAKDITALRTAVDDLVGMDCAADPDGFVATLREAHELRMAVITKGKDFRAYLKATFKPTLTEIRTQITTKKAEE